MKPHIIQLKWLTLMNNQHSHKCIDVRGVPTTAIYENGELVERVVGYEDTKDLKKD